MEFCTLCLYLKKGSTQHWCKDYFSRNKLFCEKCGVHIHICTSPSTHEASVSPDSVEETYDDDEGLQQPEQKEALVAHCVTLEDYDYRDYDDYACGHNDGYD